MDLMGKEFQEESGMSWRPTALQETAFRNEWQVASGERGCPRRDAARAKAERATKGRIIKSPPCAVKKLRAAPSSNGKHQSLSEKLQMLNLNGQFFLGRNVYSYLRRLYNLVPPLERKAVIFPNIWTLSLST